MYPNYSDADVFYMTRIIYASSGYFISIMCVLVWILISKCTPVTDYLKEMRASIVATLYLLWPAICSETFALFACNNVCGSMRLRVDVNERCWTGRHASYAFGMGVPMLLLYVIGLPVLALLMVVRVQRRSKKQNKKLETMKGHYVFGIFYTAYDSNVWWWEITLTIRKIIVAAIGVFGGAMGDMQVHVTAFLMVIIMLQTALVRPFGDRLLLQFLELSTIVSLWMTLWAGSIFNNHPRCENGRGGTLFWCDFLSLVIGSLNIVSVLNVLLVMLYYKKPKLFDRFRIRSCCGVREKQNETAILEMITIAQKGTLESKNMTELEIADLTAAALGQIDFERMMNNPMNTDKIITDDGAEARKKWKKMNLSVKASNRFKNSTKGRVESPRELPIKATTSTSPISSTMSAGKKKWKKMNLSLKASNRFKNSTKGRVHVKKTSATCTAAVTKPPINNRRRSFKKMKDQESGSFYYRNEETYETSWDEPTGADDVVF